ncbi:MAG: recombinase, partial [Alphaproteobacteria bacterium]|nr:recombinase [Alphaproteobacteria bacterium]
AEYIYGYETRSFGDPGRAFGQAIAQQFAQGLWPWPLLEAGERIRATVMGASEHSVQLSGATGYISNHAALLPRRNLPVLQPPFDFTGAMDAAGLAQAIARHRQNFGDDDPHRECVFAFRWRGAPEHARLRAFAEGLRLALADRIAAGTNLYFLIENDAAHLLGSMLREECGVTNEMAVFDSIALRDLDFCDIGRIRLPSGMTPVTIKSLLFGKPPGSGNR